MTLRRPRTIIIVTLIDISALEQLSRFTGNIQLLTIQMV
jgi:hypothetical protein